MKENKIIPHANFQVQKSIAVFLFIIGLTGKVTGQGLGIPFDRIQILTTKIPATMRHTRQPRPPGYG